MDCPVSSRTIPAAPASTAAASPSTVFPATGLFPSSLGRALLGQSGHCSRLGVGAWCDLVLAVVELVDQDHALLPCLDHELAESVESGVSLVEVGVDLLHDLFQAVGPHHVPIAGHLGHGLARQLPRVALSGWGIDFLGEAGQVVIGVVLVAVLDQQVAGGLPNADTDHVLPVLLQLDDHRREVAVTRQQYEHADLRAGKHQLDGIDGQPDIGCVFLAGPERRGKDEIDGGLGERNDVLRVAAPIGVGPLDSNLAFDDIAVEESA
jgi:hypothetical protein